MRSRLLALLLIGVLVVAGCGSDDDQGSEADATPTATETATASASPEAAADAGCRQADKPDPKDDKPGKPTDKLDPAKSYTAVVQTSCGEFRIKLDVKRAPKTTASFAHLAREGFYDGTTFHRIVPGFVIQGGDPEGTGMGGPGYSVTEAPPQSLRYDVGVVAMAKGGAEPPGASGSQFFVVTGEGGVSLPPDYALVGEISGGEEAVESIATVATDPTTEQPVDPVVIESVTIEES